ncbi:di-heme oxidoredictase family protein [Flavobacterium sp. 102]|uniref:di-heme oxidoredictase family protein n=1 Tax=Flavobacterium sp. 102 TaxID=2135623 RepID=UPI000EB4D83C|nr:di-heme oxidoredictase family protein [Flavobacterium sp. 102]RKS03398.1 CxxC motif-containing protein (DUF1111 family) [Flavobacterium sp. 102]
MKILIFILIVCMGFVSCETSYVDVPSGDELLDGTVDGLSSAELQQFLRGDVAVNEVFTRNTGLGSTFVSTSCINCHAGDGKGHPFTSLIRFGQIDETGNMYLNQGGPQLQNRALPGYLPEQLPAGATFSRFMPPAITGLGFVEAMTDASILAMADPDDLNGDGISGVVNWVNAPGYVIITNNAISQNGKYIGRFGKKAATYNLLQQTTTAYNQDMGITSAYSPIDHYSNTEIDPEVTINKINDITFYLHTLKAPIQRNQNDAQVIQGKNAFNQINCVGCHKSELNTGYSPIAALSFTTFSPYSDFLLHDMGNNLDDGYTEGTAKTFEWRTPPLWGIGLSANSQGGNLFLMHDGRAASLEQAILMHGGEAINSKNAYQNLSQESKNALLKFLKSL